MDVNVFDIVRLSDGRTGTVVDTYDGKAFCVDISGEAGKTLEIRDVKREDISEVIWASPVKSR